MSDSSWYNFSSKRYEISEQVCVKICFIMREGDSESNMKRSDSPRLTSVPHSKYELSC